MGVREIDRSLERWELGVKDLQRRMILAPTPRERERWYAMLLLAQGWTAAATAEALDRDPHTIGRWASAFGEGGSRALIFEQTGGSPPPPLTRRNRRIGCLPEATERKASWALEGDWGQCASPSWGGDAGIPADTESETATGESAGGTARTSTLMKPSGGGPGKRPQAICASGAGKRRRRGSAGSWQD